MCPCKFVNQDTCTRLRHSTNFIYIGGTQVQVELQNQVEWDEGGRSPLPKVLDLQPEPVGMGEPELD